MEHTPHLLIVEDDREISRLISQFLAKHGFRTTIAADGRSMNRALAENSIDLVLLDVMLPGEDGLSLCRRLRAESSLPIIMITALGEETDRIIGLEMGADDYMAKPLNPRELLARVRAVLRRAGAPGRSRIEQPRILTFEGWQLDLGLRQLHSPHGVRVELTSGEFDLLAALCEHPQRILTRDQLLDFTQGRSAKAFDRSIDVQVSRLRRKIEADPKHPTIITTVRSGGYLLTAEVTAS